MTRANKVGAALLALLVAIVAVREVPWAELSERFREPRVAPTPPARSVDMRKLMGTLRFTVDRGRAGRSRVSIYVNRRLVKTLPDPASSEAFEMMVIPGEYRVESVLILPPGGESPLLVHEAPRVTVEAGQTASVAVDASVGPPRALAAYAARPLTIESLQELKKSVEENYTAVQADPVFVALRDTSTALAGSTPWGGLVYVALPDNRGGARDLDAAQIRAIVAWLTDKFWGRYEGEFIRPLHADPSAVEPEELRRRFEALEKMVLEARKPTESFESIALALEKGRP